jgi:PAS domain S-box-containing protein
MVKTEASAMATDRKNILRDLIRKADAGEDYAEIRAYFQKHLGPVNPVEVDYYKDEWMKEGISEESFEALKKISLEIFRQSIQNQKPIAPKGHPLYTLMAEHALIMEYANELESLVASISSGEREPRSEFLERIRQLIGFLVETETHYLREENALFPLIEKHGLTGPTAAMWSEHQDIHTIEKEIFELNSQSDSDLIKSLGKLSEPTNNLVNLLASHFDKENNILFPASLRLLKEVEWDAVAQDFDDIGYSSYAIRPTRGGATLEEEQASVLTNEVVFGSGRLPVNILEAIFNHLPVDLTFVDAHDRVQFFSESPDRIFVRSRAVIGRSVQLCHPKKSLHVVEKILQDFREGTRNSAEFWIDVKGKKIHIRYFAVRDSIGEYLGCLEVSQDITEILKITGEKRLLD